MNGNIEFPLKEEFSVNIENINFKLIINSSVGDGSIQSIVSDTFHIHSHIELFVCTDGYILINTPNGIMKLFGGDAAIIPPNYPHTRITSENECNCRWTCISFVCVKKHVRDTDDLYSKLNKLFNEDFVVMIRGRTDFCTEITDIVSKVLQGIAVMPALRVVSALTGLLNGNDTVISDLENKTSESHSVDVDIGLLYKLNHIINSCFMNDLTNARIAEMLFISERQLSRISSKYYGMSIRNAIIERRLTTVEKLLSETNDSIESIGTSVGYKSKSGFYRDFKKKHGITPTEFRNKLRKGF